MKRISLRAIIYFSLALVATNQAFSSSPPPADHGPAAPAAETPADHGLEAPSGSWRAANPLDANLRLSIQFHDQQIYYERDDIYVKATISNGSPNVYRFRLADNRMFSLDFDIRDLGNLTLKPSDTYTTVISANKPIFARDVTILPGEDFSFIERINNYRDLKAGVFMLSARFMPELLGQPGQATLQSNRLTLTIRPDVRRAYAAEDRVAEHVQQVLVAAAIPPDQVVSYMLAARQTNEREKYLLYLDLESLYKDDPRRAESYRRMSEAERLVMLREYADSLWKIDVGAGISYIPTSFEIMNTRYAADKGEVIVLQKYKNLYFTEVKEFKYFLSKQRDVWKITTYSVTNRGNEKPLPTY